jgi:uncharacterized LabA/DUF88 family protein
MGTPSPPPRPPKPLEFEKAMVFVDGTNLFHRLEGSKLALKQRLATILNNFINGRQVIRIYLYTIEAHLEKAKNIHGDHITDKIRIVYGEGVPTRDGNIKEKGVDALLVADLVYHAAMKNYDYALVVSTDTDFVQALRRVEDFGCRTSVLAFCSAVPDRLRDVCDDSQSISEELMISNKWAAARS